MRQAGTLTDSIAVRRLSRRGSTGSQTFAAPATWLLDLGCGSQRDETVGQWRGEPLYHASLSNGEYRALLLENAFKLVDHLESDPSCGGAIVWLATRANV
jgi:hypothetical protein